MAKVNSDAEDVIIAPHRAADVPQELFQDIVWYAGGFGDRLCYSIPQNHDMVRSLCTWTLVSKYFLTFCRPRLFRDLCIRNPKQLRRLLAIIEEFSDSTSFPPIATLFNLITINPATESIIWIHQVVTVLLPRIARYRPREGSVELWANLEVQTLETQHHPAIEHLISRSVKAVTLVGVTFLRVEDLLRLLCGIVSARTIRLESVACTTLPPSSTVPRIPRFDGYRSPYLRTLSVSGPRDLSWTWIGTWFIATTNYLPRLRWDTSGLWTLLDAIHNHHALSLYDGIELIRDSHYFIEPGNNVHRMEFYRHQGGIKVTSVTLAIVFATVDGGIARRIRRVIFRIYGAWTTFPMASAEAKQNHDFWVHVVSAAAKLEDLQEVHFASDSMDILKPFVQTFYHVFQTECEGVPLIYGLVSELIWSVRVDVPIRPEDILPSRTPSAIALGAHKGNLWIATNWDTFTSRVRVRGSLACADTGRLDMDILA